MLTMIPFELYLCGTASGTTCYIPMTIRLSRRAARTRGRGKRLAAAQCHLREESMRPQSGREEIRGRARALQTLGDARLHFAAQKKSEDR
ncbi:hypothetical protein VUR80DRAFT_9318 [Thermomyces stellatus]